MMFWLGVISGVIGVWIVKESFLDYPTTPPNMKNLNRKAYGTVLALSEAILPPGGEIALSAKEAELPEFIDNYIGESPEMNARLLVLLLYIFEHGTYIFALTLRRFSKMQPEEQIQYLKSWESSPIYLRRLAFVGLRGLFGTGYMNHPQVQAAMGFDLNKTCSDALIVKRR